MYWTLLQIQAHKGQTKMHNFLHAILTRTYFIPGLHVYLFKKSSRADLIKTSSKCSFVQQMTYYSQIGPRCGLSVCLCVAVWVCIVYIR